MIVCESRAGRRVVGRLPRGAPLLDGLLGVCRDHGVRTAEIRAVGALESVEVTAYDQEERGWKPGRTFTGGLEVLSLLGNVSERAGQLALELAVTLMREGDNGVQVLGGHVLNGRVFRLEFVIETLDDVLLRRTADAATGLALWSEAVSAGAAHPAPPATTPEAPPRAPARPVAPPAPPAPPAPRAPSWADVARASSARAHAPDDEDPDEDAAGEEAGNRDDATAVLEPGDLLIHPTFGRCQVQRIEGGYEFAQVRLKNGRLVRLSLDILRVVPAGSEGPHRVFRARVDD